EGAQTPLPFRWASSTVELALGEALVGSRIEIEIWTHTINKGWVTLAMSDDEGEMFRVTVSGRQTVSATVRRSGTLRVAVTDGVELREELPVYECRPDLRYQVFAIRTESAIAPVIPDQTEIAEPTSELPAPWLSI